VPHNVRNTRKNRSYFSSPRRPCCTRNRRPHSDSRSPGVPAVNTSFTTTTTTRSAGSEGSGRAGRRANLQECVVVSVAAGLAYDNGRLLIVQLEDDVFGFSGQFELGEGLRAGWIDGNTRARLHVVSSHCRSKAPVPCLVTMKHVVREENKRLALDSVPSKAAGYIKKSVPDFISADPPQTP